VAVAFPEIEALLSSELQTSASIAIEILEGLCDVSRAANVVKTTLQCFGSLRMHPKQR
jgi:hypothetical protein